MFIHSYLARNMWWEANAVQGTAVGIAYIKTAVLVLKNPAGEIDKYRFPNRNNDHMRLQKIVNSFI